MDARFDDPPALLNLTRGFAADGFDVEALDRRLAAYLQAHPQPSADAQFARELCALMTENARKFHASEGRSARDELTAVYTRGHGLARLEEEIARARRRNGCVGTLLVDIRGLEEINAKYGFPTGDNAIRLAANALKGACRISDVVCRYAGACFLVIYVDAVAEAIGPLSRRACEQIEMRVLPVPGGAIGLKTAAGIACSTDADDAAALIARSHEDLLRVKHHPK